MGITDTHQSSPTPEDPGDSGSGRSRDRQFQLLRYSHIFATVVREILEVKYLNDVSPHSLTLSQFHLLKVIVLNGDHQVGEVANVLGVSPPAATKNLDKLEGLGLIARSRSKGDRRATMLSASENGRRLVQEYERLKSDRVRPILQSFATEDLDRFAELLERFSLRVIEQEESGGEMCLRCAAYCEDDCSVARIRGDCPYQRACGARGGGRAAEGIS